jgi:uncharacterized protein (TIGR01777 family)
MNIFIVGGTGFVGSHLCSYLLKRGHTVTALGTAPHWRYAKHPQFDYICADTTQPGSWQQVISDVDAVVNLAGKTIFKRWNQAYKQQIYDSRILTTRNIVDALPDSSRCVLCNTSAVGYYGNRQDEILTETTTPGTGFMADIAMDWEKEALRAAEKGARVAMMRFGIVLGRDGGALAQMLPAFRMFVGGPLGDGLQWFPWIHLQDLMSAIEFLLENPSLRGPFNFTAPNPVRNKELAAALGGLLGRPSFMPAPRIMLRLALGEVGMVLVDSQRAVPQNLLESGYSFQFPEIEAALRNIVKPSADKPEDK